MSGTLQRTMAAIRRTGTVVPRGVYRFATFEEADDTTRPSDAVDRRYLEELLRAEQDRG